MDIYDEYLKKSDSKILPLWKEKQRWELAWIIKKNRKEKSAVSSNKETNLLGIWKRW
jgi:hypothetical protein